MPVESIAGVRLHVQALGQPRRGTVILVHGMTTSLASFYFTIAPTLATEYRVIMYDLRGHGRSEATPSGYGIRSMAGDLAAIANRHASTGPLAIVGHSFGAVVGLRYVLDHPQRVRKLVFAEGPLPVFIEDEDDPATRDGIDADEVAESILAVQAHAVAHLPAATQEVLRGTGRRTRRVRSRTSALMKDTTLLTDLAHDQDIADAEIARCACPVLLCYGTRTLPAMEATRRRLAGLLPEVTMRMFDCGHLMLNEVPVAFGAAVGDFLRDG